MANRDISTGVKITGDASGFKSAAEQAKQASDGLKKKLAQDNLGKQTKAMTNEAIGGIQQLGGAIGGIGGDIANMAGAMTASLGPIGAVVAAIGLLAAAWKRSQENVELYLKSADKVAGGTLMFDKDADKARVDARRRYNGMIAEGLRLEDKYTRILQNQWMFLSDEQKKLYAGYVQQGREMQAQGRELKSQITGFIDKNKANDKYAALLLEQEKIEDEKLAFLKREIELTNKIAEARAAAGREGIKAADVKKFTIEAEQASLTLLDEKTALLTKELNSIKAISEVYGTQEDVEDRVAQLEAEIMKAQSERLAQETKINKIKKSTVALSDKEVKAAQETAKAAEAAAKAEHDMFISKQMGAPEKITGLPIPSVAGKLDSTTLAAPNMVSELSILERLNTQKLISEKKFLDEKRKIDLEAASGSADLMYQIETKYQEDIKKLRLENINNYAQMASQGLDAVSGMFEAAKNRELAAAGKDDKKKEEIEKKWAKRQKALGIMQALINGAMAITNLIATVPGSVINPATWAGIAVAAATTAAQVAVIASQKFAKGGIVSGPTLATVGEYAGASRNPEVIAPLDKLKALLGSETSGGQVTFRIEGDTLVGILNKYQRKQLSFS